MDNDIGVWTRLAAVTLKHAGRRYTCHLSRTKDIVVVVVVIVLVVVVVNLRGRDMVCRDGVVFRKHIHGLCRSNGWNVSCRQRGWLVGLLWKGMIMTMIPGTVL